MACLTKLKAMKDWNSMELQKTLDIGHRKPEWPLKYLYSLLSNLTPKKEVITNKGAVTVFF